MRIVIGLVGASLLAAAAWPTIGFADSRVSSSGPSSAAQSQAEPPAMVALPPDAVAADPLTPPVDPNEAQNLAGQVVPTMVVLAPDVTADGAPRPAQPGYVDGSADNEGELIPDCVVIDPSAEPSPSASPSSSADSLPSMDSSPSADPSPSVSPSAEPSASPSSSAEPSAPASVLVAVRTAAEPSATASDIPTPTTSGEPSPSASPSTSPAASQSPSPSPSPSASASASKRPAVLSTAIPCPTE